jgi:hypothetical protein
MHRNWIKKKPHRASPQFSKSNLQDLRAFGLAVPKLLVGLNLGHVLPKWLYQPLSLTQNKLKHPNFTRPLGPDVGTWSAVLYM